VQYLWRYLTLALTLEADDVRVVKWSIDALFAVQEDMWSHTCGCISLGKGMFSTTSSKQKMNTWSSTEAKLEHPVFYIALVPGPCRIYRVSLVGVDNMMVKVLWTNYFLTAQGYNVGLAVVAKDNNSSNLLENNGMKSRTKWTCHINGTTL
jgi:hypothetical protein